MPASDPILSSVDMWPLTWAPVDWALCNGQLLSIQQNTALYSLIGVTFGGDGKTNFGVPDMQGRVPVGFGKNKVTGATFTIGKIADNETVTLAVNNVPAHTHLATGTVSPKAGTGKVTLSADPTNNYPAQSTSQIYASANNVSMGQSPVTVTVQPNTGGSVPVSIMQSFLGMNYIICTQGFYPSRP